MTQSCRAARSGRGDTSPKPRAGCRKSCTTQDPQDTEAPKYLGHIFHRGVPEQVSVCPWAPGDAAPLPPLPRKFRMQARRATCQQRRSTAKRYYCYYHDGCHYYYYCYYYYDYYDYYSYYLIPVITTTVFM